MAPYSNSYCPKAIKLGEGGFGAVWKCGSPTDESFHSAHPIVAVKRIEDPDSSAEAEVDILKTLNHKNIIKFLDSFFDKTTKDLCIVMEYCDRGDITSYLPKINKDEHSVWRFVSTLSSALMYLHENNVIHRDIKPQNILCKSSGSSFTFKLADFGIAKLLNNTHRGQLYARTKIGTEIYMSPESLTAERYGKPSDIWSLGAVISAFCNGGKHLFTSQEAVTSWPGAKSSLDNTKYSIGLRQLTADMLCPTERMRPTAAKVNNEATSERQMDPAA